MIRAEEALVEWIIEDITTYLFPDQPLHVTVAGDEAEVWNEQELFYGSGQSLREALLNLWQSAMKDVLEGDPDLNPEDMGFKLDWSTQVMETMSA